MKRAFIIFLLIIMVDIVYAENTQDSNLNPSTSSLKSKKEYQSGILISTKLYDNDGTLYKEIIHGWANEIGINRIYYKNGKLKEEYRFKKGRILGHKKFDEEGQLLFDSINNHWAHRQDREFYKNGKLKNEITYKSFRISSTTKYDEQGNLIEQFVRKNVPYD